MHSTIKNKSLFNELDGDFKKSTIDILNITGTMDLSNAVINGIDTDDVTEATNLYYTESRVSGNTDVSANTTHRGRTDNPHVVTAGQVGITDLGSTAIITGGERTQITTNQTDITNLTTDVDGFPDELKNLTTSEIQQLENIGTSTVSATQWGYIGAMDQSVTSSDNPSFNSVSTDTINEKNVGAGVTVDGVLIKDGQVDGRDVSSDGTQLDTNTSNISTNTSDISTNASNISTNTSNISTNASDIASAQTDIDGFDDELKNLTTSEIQQLQNIGTSTISSTQWGYVGDMNQSLTTTDNVTFNNITSDGAIFANTLVETNTINERTVGSGVTVDSV